MKTNSTQAIKRFNERFPADEYEYWGALHRHVENFFTQELERVEREMIEKIKKNAKDHYWDSFEEDKELILKHINYIVSLSKKGGK